MIAEIITYRCSRCGSVEIVKNGHDAITLVRNIVDTIYHSI